MQKGRENFKKICVTLCLILFVCGFNALTNASCDIYFQKDGKASAESGKQVIYDTLSDCEEVAAIAVNPVCLRGLLRTTQLKGAFRAFSVVISLAFLPKLSQVIFRRTLISSVCSTGCLKVVLNYLHCQDGMKGAFN